MCPICLAAAALVAVKATSTGGLATFAVCKTRAKNVARQIPTEPETKPETKLETKP